jgi:hypothetical protein
VVILQDAVGGLLQRPNNRHDKLSIGVGGTVNVEVAKADGNKVLVRTGNSRAGRVIFSPPY